LEHAKALLEKGKLKIGTLYEYRNIEKHGDVVGDDAEGKKSAYMDINKETWTPENQPEFTKSFINIGNNNSGTIEDVILEKATNSPDYYLYCTTEVFDKNALADFGYNACILIENPEKFFAAISKVLRHKGVFEGYFKCHYQSRRVPYDKDNGIHPAIIKSLKYKPQKEIRALWKPKKKTIKPIVIDCREAAKYCKLL
jgi:hypothetical protein